MSASPSMVGGNRGLWTLRIPLEHLGARVYPDMFSLAQAHQAFDTTGRLVDAALAERFTTTISGFLDSSRPPGTTPASSRRGSSSSASAPTRYSTASSNRLAVTIGSSQGCSPTSLH